jgi:hypothetical protein
VLRRVLLRRNTDVSSSNASRVPVSCDVTVLQIRSWIAGCHGRCQAGSVGQNGFFLLALRREIYVASRNVRLDCTITGDAGGNCGGGL